MSRKDYKALDSALLDQGWALEATKEGHTRAVPPDRNQQIVHYSSSNDPRAFKNAVSQLRRSGFVWPPDSYRMRIPSGFDEEPEQQIQADETQEEEMEVAQEQLTQARADVDPDKLFNELKEARTYAALAKEALAESKRKFEEAQQALVGSEEEYNRAVKQMESCKREFDKAFQADQL